MDVAPLALFQGAQLVTLATFLLTTQHPNTPTTSRRPTGIVSRVLLSKGHEPFVNRYRLYQCKNLVIERKLRRFIYELEKKNMQSHAKAIKSCFSFQDYFPQQHFFCNLNPQLT